MLLLASCLVDSSPSKTYASSSTRLPSYAIAGYQLLGSPANTETDLSTTVHQVVNTLTWMTDRHTVKAGFDFRWSRLDIVQGLRHIG